MIANTSITFNTDTTNRTLHGDVRNRAKYSNVNQITHTISSAVKIKKRSQSVKELLICRIFILVCIISPNRKVLILSLFENRIFWTKFEADDNFKDGAYLSNFLVLTLFPMGSGYPGWSKDSEKP